MFAWATRSTRTRLGPTPIRSQPPIAFGITSLFGKGWRLRSRRDKGSGSAEGRCPESWAPRPSNPCASSGPKRVIEMQHAEFDAAFAKLVEGYSEGAYQGRRFGLTVRRSG